MKFVIFFALFLASVSGLVLNGKEMKSRNLVVPAGRPEGRITHGHDAYEGQFPYQVGLFLANDTGHLSWCGGSLLNNRFVLTAAHCTDDTVEAIVYLGSTDIYSAEVAHTVTAKNIINHPDWNTSTLAHDISVVEIPFTSYSANIQPVKLPTMGSPYTSVNGEDVIATGWGDTYDNSNVTVTRLQWAHMNIIPNRICRQPFPTVLPTHICTSTYDKVSTCLGDSGGPLVLQSSRVQVGITSFVAHFGCEKGYPAVFTRVDSYLDWINQHTGIFN